MASKWLEYSSVWLDDMLALAFYLRFAPEIDLKVSSEACSKAPGAVALQDGTSLMPVVKEVDLSPKPWHSGHLGLRTRDVRLLRKALAAGNKDACRSEAREPFQRHSHPLKSFNREGKGKELTGKR